MKKAIILLALISSVLLISIPSNASFSLFNWNDGKFNNASESIDDVINSGEIDMETESFINSIAEKSSEEINLFKSSAISNATKDISNHKEFYLTQLKQTEQQLLQRDFSDYKQYKKKEINLEIITDVENYLNNILK